MSLVNITIDGHDVQVEKGTTILKACEQLGINVPTLCNLDLNCIGVESHTASCRICVVEVEGRRNLAPACATPVMEGNKIFTHSDRVRRARKVVMELLLSDHPLECLTCPKSGNCHLQDLAADMNLVKIPEQFKGALSHYSLDESSFSIVRNGDKCIMCRRCETVCSQVQTVGCLTGFNRGFPAIVATAEMAPLATTQCTYCGQCVNVCPTGALTEKDYIPAVWRAINDKSKTVIVHTAPAVRVAFGEEFGVTGENSDPRKLAAGLKQLGFDVVFDTDFGADLTIMEEATEFISRVKSGKDLPLLTSCCPGWINFLETQFHDCLNLPSSCKSPMQMTSSMIKHYYAEKKGIAQEDLVVVSVMPCLAKKYEANRDDFKFGKFQDTDYVLSTRELVRMFKQAGINPYELEGADFDNPMGESTGAATIFGASGGVMEAALRTAQDWITGKELEKIDFEAVRGFDGVKEATVEIGDLKIKAAIVSGLGNARKVLQKIKDGTCDYHILEVMACPGGCLNGGGQPYINGKDELLKKRLAGLYSLDKGAQFRKSHKNPSIIKLYDEFLGKPGDHKAHELLHTQYHAR